MNDRCGLYAGIIVGTHSHTGRPTVMMVDTQSHAGQPPQKTRLIGNYSQAGRQPQPGW